MGIFDWKHWAVILLVVLVLFCGKRLRQVGSDVGEAIKGFRKSLETSSNEAVAEKQPGSSGTREG